MDDETWRALMAQLNESIGAMLYPPTHPKGHRAMSYDPVQRCTNTKPHGPHVWNAHESMVPSMRAQNPNGERRCLGVKDMRTLTAGEVAYLRKQMDVYLRPHLPTTRDTATVAPVYKHGDPPRPLWADLLDTP